MRPPRTLVRVWLIALEAVPPRRETKRPADWAFPVPLAHPHFSAAIHTQFIFKHLAAVRRLLGPLRRSLRSPLLFMVAMPKCSGRLFSVFIAVLPVCNGRLVSVPVWRGAQPLTLARAIGVSSPG